MDNLSPGVEIRRGSTGDSIRVTFYLNGRRCRETLKIDATPANIKYAGTLLARVKNAIERGIFDYSESFPQSRIVRNQPSEAKALCNTPQKESASIAAKQKIFGMTGELIEHVRKNRTKDLSEILGMPRFSCRDHYTGIYFLVSDGSIVYVGQSRNVHVRVMEHYRSGRSFDSYTYIPCDGASLDVLEAAYIDKFSPEQNVTAPFAHMLKTKSGRGADLGHNAPLKSGLIDAKPEKKKARKP